MKCGLLILSLLIEGSLGQLVPLLGIINPLLTDNVTINNLTNDNDDLTNNTNTRNDTSDESFNILDVLSKNSRNDGFNLTKDDSIITNDDNYDERSQVANDNSNEFDVTETTNESSEVTEKPDVTDSSNVSDATIITNDSSEVRDYDSGESKVTNAITTNDDSDESDEVTIDSSKVTEKPNVTNSFNVTTGVTVSNSTVSPEEEEEAKPTLIETIIFVFRLLFQDIINNVSSILGIKIGEEINPMQIMIRGYELSQSNINSIVPQCYFSQMSYFSLGYFKRRLVSESKTCVFNHVERIKENLNGTVEDIQEIVSGFQEFIASVTKLDYLGAIVGFELEETRVLMDLSERIASVSNATISMALIPTCFVSETIGTFQKVKSDIDDTVVCVKEKLEKNGVNCEN